MSGASSPQELIQKYEVKITQTALDILIDEGLLPVSGATLFEIQKAIVTKEEQGEVTSSSNTQLAPMGDNKAGTSKVVNGENRSSGSAVGFGQWVGTFSGSADIFRTGSGFEAFHFTHFSGSLSGSSFNVGNKGTSNYGRVFIGAPEDLVHPHLGTFTTASLGTTPGGQKLIPKVFSGSFKCTSVGFHTVESGSASGSSRIFGTTTSSNVYIPGGTYTAKWISGSFPNGIYYTSSTVTQVDINNISQSLFYGSICVATGGFDTTTTFSTTHTYGNIFNGGQKLNATCESAFAVKGRYAGQFRNSGSLVDNDNTGAIISGLTGGTIFAIAPLGDAGTAGYNLVSGSIESLTNGGYSNRGPGNPYVNGTAKQSYFTTKRTVSVTGEVDKFQKDVKKASATTNFLPR